MMDSVSVSLFTQTDYYLFVFSHLNNHHSVEIFWCNWKSCMNIIKTPSGDFDHIGKLFSECVRYISHIVTIIILLLQEKCGQYWPSDGVVVYGDTSIELKREDECESYTVRDLLVTNNRVRKHLVKPEDVPPLNTLLAPQFSNPRLSTNDCTATQIYA